MSGTSTSEGSWPGGWVVAAAAGVVAAILARWLGNAPMSGAVLVGLVVFVVFGVLLGMFWAEPASAGSHGHDNHGHDGHGHDGHGHGPGHDNHMPAAAPVVVMAPAPAPVAAPVIADAPVVAPAPVVLAMESADPVAKKPAGLAAPRDGRGDDLQVLEGIGPAMEKLCHELGFFHYDQIAGWGPAEVAWMDSNLKGFKGRVTRDKWVRQARLIGEVGIEEFKRRAKTNDY